MLELTVNRNVARSILDALVTQSLSSSTTTNDSDMDVDKKYQVVRMISKNINGKQRMELVNGGNEGSIFSIALSTSENNNDSEKVHLDTNEDDGDESMDEDDVDENGNPIEKKSSSSSATNNTVSGVLQQLAASHEKSLSIQESFYLMNLCVQYEVLAIWLFLLNLVCLFVYL